MGTNDATLWAGQQRFRDGLERTARLAFAAAGFDIEARAHLVGLALDADVADHPVATEPPDPTLAREINRAHGAGAGSDRGMRLVHHGFDHSPHGIDRVVCIGRPGTVAGRHAVYPVLTFPASRWESKPSLRSRSRSGQPVAASFQDALATQLLIAATAALCAQQAPSDFGAHVDRSLVDETLRRAAGQVTESAAALAGLDARTELHHAMDAVAAQPYEGRAGFGRVVLAAPEHPEVDMRIRFLEPIPVSSTRRFRKALEVTSDVLSLVCDGTELAGLGLVRRRARPPEDPDGAGHRARDYDPSESIFELDVLGRGDWQLSHRSAPLLRVSNTRPVFPELPLSAEAFHTIASWIFPEADERGLRALWDLADTASRAEHGTILVFHRDAAGEARRLAAQAQRVEAEVLGPRAVEAITGIDGAVLLDTAGRCHAIGVILDGVASEAGDPGRGSRYNSAVRYHEGPGAEALIVVVSEDGMIDLVPNPLA